MKRLRKTKNKNRILTGLRKRIIEAKLDALLISNEQNIKYLTGFSTSGGVALITEDDAFFFTGLCEFKEAESQISLAKVKEVKRNDWGFLKDLVKRKKIGKLGYEENYLSITDFKKLKKGLYCRLKNTNGFIEELRAVKSAKELDKIKKAISITEKVLAKIKKLLKPGLSEQDIVRIINVLIAKEGGRPAFDPIAAAGAHSACPHAQPGRRRFKRGELFLIDLGVEYQGYKSDMTRTFVFGPLGRKQEKVYNLVLETQKTVQDFIKPWMTTREIDKKAHLCFQQKGWGKFFPHSIGHGVGLDVHEHPFFSDKSPDRLVPGMIFTLEPAFYLQGWGGIRIEDMYLVTSKKCRKLTGFSTNPFLN